jgi:dTDP-4-amino-4,6-dideoxygalactose transaminase
MIGYWLGDGTSCRSEITTNDPEIVEYYVDRLPEIDCKIKREKDKSGMHYYISGINNVKAQGQKGRNKFLTSLKNLNLINNKHIPDIYKINSRENRLER